MWYNVQTKMYAPPGRPTTVQNFSNAYPRNSNGKRKTHDMIKERRSSLAFRSILIFFKISYFASGFLWDAHFPISTFHRPTVARRSFLVRLYICVGTCVPVRVPSTYSFTLPKLYARLVNVKSSMHALLVGGSNTCSSPFSSSNPKRLEQCH